MTVPVQQLQVVQLLLSAAYLGYAVVPFEYIRVRKAELTPRTSPRLSFEQRTGAQVQAVVLPQPGEVVE